MSASLAKPTRIGAYDIVDVIGRGGMGTVYKATDPRIGRSVAIKVLLAASDDPDLLTRFYREAKYTGSLQHHNIVTVYELGHQDGTPYLVMEYLEGVSLDVVIASNRLIPIAEKLRIILQVCSGLSYAHKRDLVHRDIKPANIVILENGIAKLVDFGIARLGGNGMTRTGQIVGSLNYMSPEQLDSKTEVDLRTDVYSAGVVLYQLLTGVLPFDGGSTAATLMKIVHEPPAPMKKYWKECPPELEEIIQTALAKNRDDRYTSADDFALDLGRVHQQYEKRLLSEYLQQAETSLKRKDFSSARQQVEQALRAAPHNTEAGELMRLINKGQEQEQRGLQAQKFKVKAESAFRKKDLSGAQQFVEEGLRFHSTNAELLALREAIEEERAKAAQWQAAMRRAEAALHSDKLEAASQFTDEAIEILPDDTECRALASGVLERIQQRSRELKAEQQHRAEDARRLQKDFALNLAAIEKTLADARRLLSKGQAQKSLNLLQQIESGVAQLPPQWGEQLEELRREAQAKVDEDHLAITSEWDHSSWPGQDSSNSFKPMDSGHPGIVFGNPAANRDRKTPARPNLYSHYSEPTMVQRSPLEPEETVMFTESTDVAKTPRSSWLRPIAWVGIAAAILVIVVASLFLFPNLTKLSREKQPTVSAIPAYTYAEINAEPWGTIQEIVPAKGESQSAVGEATPTRIKLPPGQYTLTLAGPNNETRQVTIEVPAQGGASTLIVFKKPDIKKLLSQK